MFGILSPVSELEWASCSHEVLSSPMLVSLAVGFPEKNKRVVSFFFCPALAIKAIKEKKNPSFFPHPLNLYVSQLRSSQPSRIILSKTAEVTENAVVL